MVIGSDDAHIYAWQANGSAIGDWPQATASSVRGTPVLANLDSDDELEVIVGDFGGNIYTVGGYLRLYLPLLVRNP